VAVTVLVTGATVSATALVTGVTVPATVFVTGVTGSATVFVTGVTAFAAAFATAAGAACAAFVTAAGAACAALDEATDGATDDAAATGGGAPCVTGTADTTTDPRVSTVDPSIEPTTVPAFGAPVSADADPDSATSPSHPAAAIPPTVATRTRPVRRRAGRAATAAAPVRVPRTTDLPP
jgi:hypothetical protein